ncbi:MAG TPA: hypothetical protein VHZ95_01770, partial [Polyangiales bacterium]|nr:hypothetical protein [Polyangiales bacterium]
RMHWGEVARDEQGELVTSGIVGYVGVATGVGDSVEHAQAEAYALARQVGVPNVRFRNDIGDRFIASSRAELQRLGYLPPCASGINSRR